MVKLSHLCIRKELEVETGIQVFIMCLNYVLGKTECLKKLLLVVLKDLSMFSYHTFKVYCTLIKRDDTIFNHPYMVRYQNSCVYFLFLVKVVLRLVFGKTNKEVIFRLFLCLMMTFAHFSTIKTVK